MNKRLVTGAEVVQLAGKGLSVCGLSVTTNDMEGWFIGNQELYPFIANTENYPKAKKANKA